MSQPFDILVLNPLTPPASFAEIGVPALQLLTLPPTAHVSFRFIAPTLRYDLGQGVLDTRRRLIRPIHEFTIQLEANDREEAEALYSFARFHQADTPFLFNGEGYNILENPVLLGVGDGSRVDFLLPFRRAIGESWLIFLDHAEEPVANYSITDLGGILTMDAAPATPVRVEGIGDGQFLCKFMQSGDELNDREEFKRDVFSHGITIREVGQE